MQDLWLYMGFCSVIYSSYTRDGYEDRAVEVLLAKGENAEPAWEE